MSDTTGLPLQRDNATDKKTHWATAGGVLGAVAASSCCIVPLLLVSAGISGAWIGNLTALAPYKPIFIVFALGFLSYSFLLVHRQSKTCADDSACGRPLPNRVVKSSLWISVMLITIALFWSWIAPVIAPILLNL